VDDSDASDDESTNEEDAREHYQPVGYVNDSRSRTKG